MSLHRSACATYVFAALAVLTTAATSHATDFAEVTGAGGHLRRYVSDYAFPVPYCWLDWDRDPADGPTFDEVLVEYFDYAMCTSGIIVRCVADTLEYAGSWPQVDLSGITHYGYTTLEANLVAMLEVHLPTQLRAQRWVAGDLLTLVHSVTVTLPDQSEVMLLDEGEAPAEAEMTLQPGAYQVTIDVNATTHSRVWEPYAGLVIVTWADASTPVEAATWGTVKSLYR